MLIAEVLIEYSTYQLDRTFSYLADGLDLQLGQRVYVKFNNRKVVGIVLDTKEYNGSIEDYQKEFNFKINKIDSIIDNFSILNKELIDLAYFLKKTTISPLISCFSVMLPSKLKPSSNFGKKSILLLYK